MMSCTVSEKSKLDLVDVSLVDLLRFIYCETGTAGGDQFLLRVVAGMRQELPASRMTLETGLLEGQSATVQANVRV